jgi:energy-coupling factor transporter transmembrane protein EcfT
VGEALERAGLSALRTRDPLTLSGGEQRRLSVAAFLALRPEILIVDEPFTSLDFEGVQSVLSLLLDLHRDGTGIVVITHDLEKAVAHAGRLESPVHTLDARVKLLLLAVFSVAAVVLPGAAPTGVLAAGLVAAYAVARRNPVRALAGAPVFLVLAAVVVLSHALDAGGISASGAARGAEVSTGFLIVVLAVELIISTTPVGRITDVVHWLLRCLPGVNAGRVALMAGLAVTHALVLRDAAARSREALEARGVSARSGPVRYLRILAVALIRETVEHAERTTDALFARGYSDERTPPAFAATSRDAVAVACTATVIGAAVLSSVLLAR